MDIIICVPEIKVEITNRNKVDFVLSLVDSLMDNIFYKDELGNDVITIHDVERECVTEIMLKPNPVNGILKGFMVLNEWYCFPDAKYAVVDIIQKLFIE